MNFKNDRGAAAPVPSTAEESLHHASEDGTVTRRSEFSSGVRAQLPMLLAVFPFGLLFGAVARDAGLSPLAALATSSVIFAGSAQFVAVSLYRDLSPAVVMVLTIFIVNLRHSLYSASLAQDLRHLRAHWKWLLAYLLTDEAYAVVITHYNATARQPQFHAHRHWYFFGTAITLWCSWQISTALGILVGGQIPPGLLLDFVVPLTFIALLIPALADRAGVAAALVAGAVAAAGAGWPYKLGLFAAALAGIAAGVLLENLRAREVHSNAEGAAHD
ncbi:MAG: branched-chain amino acid ABC transporter permease [Chloroflexi bacterium]|nr:MAG: branched-chain amino acid ABC transporter permease [Chloroflexota bacterium]